MSELRLDIIIVTYFPEDDGFSQLLRSIATSHCSVFSSMELYVCDNSCNDAVYKKLEDIVATILKSSVPATVVRSEANIGFGRGVNLAAELGRGDWILLLNQDTVLESDCLRVLGEEIVRIGKSTKKQVAAIECRQIPYEHPKRYNPVSLEVPWASAAACLVRRAAFEAVGGFEPMLFMYAEDVDLSWRMRAEGYQLRYCPKAAVIHHTYQHAGEEKALQAIEGTLNNLFLRARYGSRHDIVAGMRGVARQILLPESFPGRRKAFMRLPFRFLRHYRAFRKSGKMLRSGGFRGQFCGWDYALHRDGAFYPFRSRDEWSEFPLVSIIVRTYKRPTFLREALFSLVNQTYPNIEVIVVEDDAAQSENIVNSILQGQLRFRYVALGRNRGRSYAGNLGLSLASGDWLGFLDDDDQLFCDHVEVLVQSVLEKKVKGAYAGTWEVETDVISHQPLEYEELCHRSGFRHQFSRYLLWKRNYIPIQSVLFHRELYERYDGFDENMTFLEDWNLWTRYTLENDFYYVDKTTSIYRVPANKRTYAVRQADLDNAYAQAIERQKNMSIAMTPVDFVRACDEFNTYSSIIENMENPIPRSRIVSYASTAHKALRLVRRKNWQRV